MEKKCEECGEPFDAARATARYCTDGCRVKHGRVSVTAEVLSVTKNLSVTPKDELSVTKNLSVTKAPARVLDVVDDLKMDLHKDLGISGWTKDGVFIRPDITVRQVQTIVRLVHARHGRICPEFRLCVNG